MPWLHPHFEYLRVFGCTTHVKTSFNKFLSHNACHDAAIAAMNSASRKIVPQFATSEITKRSNFCYSYLFNIFPSWAIPTVSMMKAKKPIQQGSWFILACVINVRGKEKTLDNVPIVNEFPNVFLEDLPGVPPSRAIDFAIKLEPRTEPISKTPYRMMQTEL